MITVNVHKVTFKKKLKPTSVMFSKFVIHFIGIIAYASQSLGGHQTPAENEKLTVEIVNQTTSAGIDVIGIFFFREKRKTKTSCLFEFNEKGKGRKHLKCETDFRKKGLKSGTFCGQRTVVHSVHISETEI